MENIKIRTRFFLAAIVLLLCVLVPGCSTETPDSLKPTYTFDVNINVNAGENGTTKTIIVDGDTIIFSLVSYQWYGVETYLIIATNAPGFEILNIKHDGFNLYTNAYDTTHYYADASDVNTLDSGIIINDSYNNHSWLPFVSHAGRYYNPVYSKLFQFNADGYQYLIQGMPRNRNQYIVLRKLAETQYQYYWIRVWNDNPAPFMIKAINTKVLNGKYQLNSITTGQ